MSRPNWAIRLALLCLCAAYLQGGLDKLLDFPGAVAETADFGVPLPVPATLATIVTELVGSALLLMPHFQRLGALWLAGFTAVATLLADRFWTLPPGPLRIAHANGFFEHVGLIGGFLLAAATATPILLGRIPFQRDART